MVLGASFDTPAENLAFRDKFAFPFDLLCDTSREMGLAYGATDDRNAGYPKRISYLIDPQGKVVQVYGEVKPAEHPHQVLADLG